MHLYSHVVAIVVLILMACLAVRQLVGIVTNITAFGCFVDIGVHQDGLVHISQMSNQFIKDPNEVVKLNQKVRVTVTELDVERKRISLSMKINVAK